MKTQKIIHLKNFCKKVVFKSLVKIKNTLPKDFLSTKNLKTRKTVTDRINKIINCSSINAVSKHIVKDTGEIKHTILIDNSCGQYVLCPVCSRTRADKIRASYIEPLHKKIKEYKRSQIYFITFTIINEDNFLDAYDKFNTSIKAFMKKGQVRHGYKDKGESSKIDAAIMGIECKQGEGSGKWHVHGHMLAFCNNELNYSVYDPKKKAALKKVYPGRIPKNKLNEIASSKVEFQGKTVNVSKLSLEWYLATSGLSINIKAKPLNVSKSLEKQINEIIKYPTKLSDLPEEKILDLLVHKDRKRFLRVYGSLRGAIKGVESEELIGTEESDSILLGIETRKYNTEQNKFLTNDNSLNILANELYQRRPQLKDFLRQITRARNFKEQILKSVKVEVFIKTLENKEFKDYVINEVDSIFDAFRAFSKLLFRQTVFSEKKFYHQEVMAERVIDYYTTFRALKLT